MRNDLRYGRFWLIFGWVSVTVALVLNLMPARELHGIHLNDKFEHIAGYVLLTSYFCGLYPRSRYWLIVLAFASMGAVVEVLQGSMHWGRSEDIRDFYADCIGISIGLLLALLGMYQWPCKIEWFLTRL